MYDSSQETFALLKLLELGNEEIAAGQLKPLEDVAARLKEKWQERRLLGSAPAQPYQP